MVMVFLDRDGTINQDPGDKGFVTRWEEFRFIPGAKAAIRELTEAGFSISIVSNQSGISRGIFTKETLEEITGKMTAEIHKAGGRLHKVLYCTHDRDEGCGCRKPAIGMLKEAVNGLPGGLNGSYMVGDSKADVDAGKAAGCRTVLLLSGKTKPGESENWDVKPDIVLGDITKAADWIIENEKIPRKSS